jgi:hypothetical protein
VAKTAKLVYPDGTADVLVGAGPLERGSFISGRGKESYIVGYVRRRYAEEDIAFLNPLPGAEPTLCKLSFFEVNSANFRLTLAEAAELADRLRLMAGGSLDSAATVVAVRMEQMVEEDPTGPARMEMLESEKTALRVCIEGWLTEVGAAELPARVMNLRYALLIESTESS